jgi:penicillin-binding protein A
MTLERRAWNICRAAILLLIVLSLRLVYWQMVRGEDLKPTAIDLVQAAEEYPLAENGGNGKFFNRIRFLTGVTTVKQLESIPQPVIQRTIDFLDSITRGSIYDRNGRLLAYDQRDEEGRRFRFYSEPSLAHVIGYVSGMRTGVTGIELSYNDSLLGLDRPDSHIARMLHKPITGSDLYLTIDSELQRRAERALRNKTGVILVLDAKSGAVLALANAPRFDPNRILDHVYVSELVSSCGDALHCRAPFLNRAAQGLYSPGSTWKTIPLIAALETGQAEPDTVFDFGEPLQGTAGPYYVYRVDGGTIPDFNHSERQLNLEMAYAKSANAAFARMGDEMAPEVFIDYASRFGFGSPGEIQYHLDIEWFPAQLANEVGSLYENNLLRAVTAIGQGELLATPIHIGMMVLPVVNEGSLPVPYFVNSVKEPYGRENDTLKNRKIVPGMMNPQTAEQVREMMVSVVEKGSGQSARLPGLVVGGKTGTAQVGGGMDPHSWFAGFAMDDDRGVVVVVLIEHGGEGSRVAAPIFAELVEAAFQLVGEPGEAAPAPPDPIEAPAPTPEPEDAPISTIPQESEEPGPQPEEPEEPPAPEPAPDPEEDQSGVFVPPPDIPRDPAKKDITAANPSCANYRDMPEATGAFIWPSAYQALSGGDFKEGHPGIDLASPLGSPVFAADTGLVIFAGWSGLGYGNSILIDHGNGFQTLYAHLSQVSVYCGARVEKGKLIGLSGNTGNSTGPHLHFEVRVPGGYINPLRVLPIP